MKKGVKMLSSETGLECVIRLVKHLSTCLQVAEWMKTSYPKHAFCLGKGFCDDGKPFHSIKEEFTPST